MWTSCSPDTTPARDITSLWNVHTLCGLMKRQFVPRHGTAFGVQKTRLSNIFKHPRNYCFFQTKWYELTLRSPMVTVCTTTLKSQKFHVQHTRCIYVFCVDLRTNSDFYARLKSCVKRLPSSFQSVRPSAWNSAPNGWIFTKFNIWVFFENLSGKCKFN